MKRVLSVAVVLAVCVLGGCSGDEPKPVSEAGEKLYTIRGVILSRNASANTIFMDHEEIPGFMTAMKMDYAVRGADVQSLPPNKSRIEAKLHVTARAYWITDVKRRP